MRMLDLFLKQMRTRRGCMTACLIMSVFVKLMHGKPLCSNGLYEHWIAEIKDFVCCREVNVTRGYEAVPCTEHGNEDRVQKCPNGTHQPDDTLSSNSPHCIANPSCTDLGIRKKCFEGYCWPVCTCSLEHGKCGLNPLDCTDIEKIKCPWKVLEDCSCAPLVITSIILTSPPSTIMNTTDLSKQSSLTTLRSNPSTGSTNAVTTDGDDDTKDGSEKGNEWTVAGVVIGVTVLAVLSAAAIALCVCCKCKKENRLKRVSAEEIALISYNIRDPVMNELNIHVPESPEHERVTRQLTLSPPRPRFTGSLPEPVLPGSQPAHSDSNSTSKITCSTWSISSQESIVEPETGPDGSDSSWGSSADHGSEEADPSKNHMSHGSEDADPSRNHMSYGSEEIDPSRNHMSHGSEDADPSRNRMSHGLNGLNTDLRSELYDLGMTDLSQGSSADCRAKKADVNGHSLSHRSNTEHGAEALSYLTIRDTETSLQRVPPICKVAPIMRQVQSNQSFVVRQVQNNQSSAVSQVQTNQFVLGSLGPSLRIDSLLSDNSIWMEEAGNTHPMEQIRELQSGDANPQTEANTLDQFQLCTKAAVNHNCGEQGAVQAYDPENTDMKVVLQNESSEMNAEEVDSENTLLMKAFKEEEFSSDLGQNYTNNNVKNKPTESFLARRNSINFRNVLTADFQAELNMEPSQEMNSVCHSHGKSEQVLSGQSNSTQNLCSDVSASSDERLKVVKDAKSHEMDTSQDTCLVVITQLTSFMSGDSLLCTKSNNPQSIFPSSATQSRLTEGNNFDDRSLHGRQENPTRDRLGMYTASGEIQRSTSREYLSQHSSLYLAQKQSTLEKIPPRSFSCPVLHPKLS